MPHSLTDLYDRLVLKHPQAVFLIVALSIAFFGIHAPDFKLDSHLDREVTLSEFKGKKNVLLVSYPLDFTPT